MKNFKQIQLLSICFLSIVSYGALLKGDEIMIEDNYAVHWKSKITGFSGKGQPMSKKLAMLWEAEGNRNYADLNHWIEKVNITNSLDKASLN